MVKCYNFKDDRERGTGRGRERQRDGEIFEYQRQIIKNRIFSTHTQKLHAGKQRARKSKTNYLILKVDTP